MNPFIRTDQYHFIKAQTNVLLNGHLNVNDASVLQALRAYTFDKVINQLEELTEEQRLLLQPINDIREEADAEAFLQQIKPYVIPFEKLTESAVKKLFPKAKKLKLPSLDGVDWQEMTYFSFEDNRSNKKYIITYEQQHFIGIDGTFRKIHKKEFAHFVMATEKSVYLYPK